MLLDVFMPGACACCSRAGSTFCFRCEAELACTPAIVLAARGSIPPITALGRHEGRLRAAVLSLKFRGAAAAGQRLGRWLAAKLVLPFDVIVPVPLHASRLRERGYNQAMLIARGIGAIAQAPIVERALIRRVATKAQSKLALSERRINVGDAFAPGPACGMVRGRRVLLVDDVVTSGATAAACARELHASGARCVSVACAAVRL